MVSVTPDSGLDFIENRILGETTATLNTIAVGTGTLSPSQNDTSLSNEVYNADSKNNNTIIESTSNTGEIRLVIQVTGGTEVPSETDISEIGVKASDGTLVYREVRSSPVTVSSGETKKVEFRLKNENEDVENKQTITNEGLDRIVDILLGNSTNYIDTIAVGDSTNNVSKTDTTMFAELSRDNDSASNVLVESTTNTGQILARTTISAGNDVNDEVPGGSDISEFGILTSDGLLVLHETRTPITLQSNDEKAFEIPFKVQP